MKPLSKEDTMDEEEPLLPVTNPDSNPTHARRKSLIESIFYPLFEEDNDDDDDFTLSPPPSPSFKEQIIFGSNNALGSSSSDHDHPNPIQNPILIDPIKAKVSKVHLLHRCRTAPAMAAINEIVKHNNEDKDPNFGDQNTSFSRQIARRTFVFLLIYLGLGVLMYTLAPGQFSSEETHPVVDALYFSIVTMCTIGYGDITPTSPFSKIFSVIFVLVGFGFIDILLSGMVSYFLDLQESLLLSTVSAKMSGGKHDARSYIVDIKKGRMRIRMKVTLALGVVVLCVGVGTAVLHFVERLGFLDSFYLSVMSVTTVGYGDRAFKTMVGRLFASVWLLVSTLAVARAFLYLAELRIDKRHRRIAKFVLGRDMTVAEFLQADIDHNGFVSKSEFVVYKLKEMGKVSEKDIAQICTQFDKLDSGNFGKITLADLVEGH